MRRLTILALCAAALGCGDFKEIFGLMRGLSREFSTSAINVKFTNSSLSVVFNNSEQAKLPEPERAAFARRVAEYVRDNYPRYGRLQSIRVGFASVQGAGGVSFTSTEIPYQFTPAELGPPQHRKESIAPKTASGS